MSDIEEPPTKISKMEQAPPSLDSTEEGQEEWLSEGLLTDDDYPDYTVGTKEQDKSDTTSQGNEDTMQSMLDGSTDPVTNAEGFQKTLTKTSDEGIEETLKTLESGQHKQDDTQFSEDLDQFLIRKVDGKVASVRADDNRNGKKDDNDDDDGNSTDDLLRMLEEDSGRSKVTSKSVEKTQAPAVTSDDDGEDLFRGGRKTRAQVAKSIMQKVATKAEPEDMSDTDSSSDEASVMKSIFVQKQQPKLSKPASNSSPKPSSQQSKPASRGNYAAKSTAKPTTPQPQRAQRTTKPVLTTKVVGGNNKVKFAHSTPLIIKSSRNKPEMTKINLVQKIPTIRETRQTIKIEAKQAQNKLPQANKPQVSKAQTSKLQTSKAQTSKPQTSKVQTSKAQTSKVLTRKAQTRKAQTRKPSQPIKPESSSKPKFKPKSNEPDEIINEEESLEDEEDFDLTEQTDLTEEKVAKNSDQKLMKPEEMDEEVPSDAESCSEDGSIYRELPTSDSESEEDWFTIDVRGERAGEYLAMLGDSAGVLLTEEKERVTQRLASIKQSLAALTDSSSQQRDELNAATVELAELDALLAAA